MKRFLKIVCLFLCVAFSFNQEADGQVPGDGWPVVRFPPGTGCALKYGPLTGCDVETAIIGDFPSLCSGFLPGNQSANEGNTCGTYSKRWCNTCTWKVLLSTENGFAASNCGLYLCSEAGYCEVAFDDMTEQWYCQSIPGQATLNYFVHCDLDLAVEVICIDAPPAPDVSP
jgi:hypothetical protein